MYPNLPFESNNAVMHVIGYHGNINNLKIALSDRLWVIFL